MVISHHGRLEFGSPKLPQFPEAILLHYLDDMDSKMEAMRGLIESDRQSSSDFTGYNPALERTLLKKEQYLSHSGSSPVSAAAPVPSVAPVHPPAAVAKSLPKPTSLFSEKLQLALVAEPEN
jgi:3'-5' exoribonuclease